MDANQFTDNHRSEYFNNYMKYLTRQFMGYFGKTTHIFNKLILMYFFKVWFSDLLKKKAISVMDIALFLLSVFTSQPRISYRYGSPVPDWSLPDGVRFLSLPDGSPSCILPDGLPLYIRLEL